MLFSDEEPIVAHKLPLMEKAISELLSGHKTLFSLVGEKLESASSSTSSTATSTIPTAETVSTATPPGQVLSFA